MVEWVKVKDRVPKDERFYLCWCADNSFGLGFYTKKISKEYGGEYRWVIGNEINENVVAWAYFNYFDE